MGVQAMGCKLQGQGHLTQMLLDPAVRRAPEELQGCGQSCSTTQRMMLCCAGGQAPKEVQAARRLVRRWLVEADADTAEVRGRLLAVEGQVELSLGRRHKVGAWEHPSTLSTCNGAEDAPTAQWYTSGNANVPSDRFFQLAPAA